MTVPAWGTTRSRGRMNHAQMRNVNMGLILRRLHEEGELSRAELANLTGLSKATMTSLISDLVERDLVREGRPDRQGSVGRPGVKLSCAGDHVCAIGIEINYDYIAMTVTDLAGESDDVSTEPIRGAASDWEGVVEQLADLVQEELSALRARGRWVAGIGVGAPGVIDYETRSVRFAPNLGWRDVPLGDALEQLLGEDAPPLFIENDGKLSAFAATRGYVRDGVRDLVYLTGGVGIGAGIITDGRVVRGWRGFSGEVGHMQVDPDGRECRCGRRGCWETKVGFPVLLSALETEARDSHRPILERLAELVERWHSGEPAVARALESIRDNLVPGLSILVDVLNPQLIILGGYFAYFADALVEPLTAALADRRITEGGTVKVIASELGLHAAAQGGASAAMERVFQDPACVPGASL